MINIHIINPFRRDTMRLGRYKNPAVEAIEKFRELVVPGEGVRVLDTGAGEGRNYVELLVSPYEVYANDWEWRKENELYRVKKRIHDEIKERKERGEEIPENVPLNLYPSSIQELPFENECFDGVFAHAIPTKYVDPEDMFNKGIPEDGWRDAHRVLKKGGHAYALLIQAVLHHRPWKRKYDWGFRTEEHEGYHTERVRSWFEDVGFEVVSDDGWLSPERGDRGRQSTLFLELKLRKPATPSGSR